MKIFPFLLSNKIHKISPIFKLKFKKSSPFFKEQNLKKNKSSIF